jgi:hypothetical protein
MGPRNASAQKLGEGFQQVCVAMVNLGFRRLGQGEDLLDVSPVFIRRRFLEGAAAPALQKWDCCAPAEWPSLKGHHTHQ